MISIVIPVFNEEINLQKLTTEILKVIKEVNLNYEIIFVDDGSTDKSFEILSNLTLENEYIKVLSLSRNFGQQAAYTAGMKCSKGDILILMDADLQDPPCLIPQFIEKLNQGYDVAYAVRKNREGALLKRISYFLFYRFLKLISPLPIHLDSGDFGAISRRVADQINRMPERHRFLRGLRSYVGFKQVAVPYKRMERAEGKAKYGMLKLLGLASDGIFGFSLVPLRLATVLGFLISSISIIYGLHVVIWRITSDTELPGWATLATALTFLGGLQLLFMGIIGEYVGRIFAQVTTRPEYIVKEKLNIE